MLRLHPVNLSKDTAAEFQRVKKVLEFPDFSTARPFHRQAADPKQPAFTERLAVVNTLDFVQLYFTDDCTQKTPLGNEPLIGQHEFCFLVLVVSPTVLHPKTKKDADARQPDRQGLGVDAEAEAEEIDLDAFLERDDDADEAKQ